MTRDQTAKKKTGTTVLRTGKRNQKESAAIRNRAREIRAIDYAGKRKQKVASLVDHGGETTAFLSERNLQRKRAEIADKKIW